MSAAKKKHKKDSFTARMKRRGREFKDLGHKLTHEPRAFPGALLNVVRRFVRTLWDARGGGFYACGYVITFLWLEIKMIVEDIVTAQSAGAFLGQQIFELLFRYVGESLGNMVKSFIWPVFILQRSPAWGIVALGVMYLLFARFLKARIESWLFEGGDDTRARSGDAQLDSPEER